MFKFLHKIFAVKNHVFYIATAGEILPEKLSSDAELEMTNKMKVGSDEARNQLIERNLRLVVYTAQK